MTIEISAYSTTAASNNTASPNGWPEGMAPSGVNDSARENMAGLARWYKDNGGGTSCAGGTTAYTLAVNVTTAAAAVNETFWFKVNATNTGAVTINITPSGGAARGAVAVQKGTVALVAGDWIIGDIVGIAYDGTQYQMVSPDRAVTGTGKNVRDTLPTFPSGFVIGHEALNYYDEGTFTGTWVPSVGSITSYLYQTFSYTRIGNRVFFNGAIALNVAGTPSGTLLFAGLPFTVANPSPVTAAYSGVTVTPRGWAATLTTPTVGVIVNNATTFNIWKYAATGGVVTTGVAADLANTCDCDLSGHYRV